MEYQYNIENKPEKIFYFQEDNSGTYYKYELFEYKDDMLNVKRTYHYVSDSEGWRMHDSTVYSYQDEKLISEKIFFNLTISNDTVTYEYIYENSTNVEKRKYNNQIFEWLTKYDYLGDLCIKESVFSDISGNNRIEYIVHTYDDGILVKSEKFLNNNIKIQTITYTYDDEGKLIIEQSEQTDYTVTIQLDYVIKYEYY